MIKIVKLLLLPFAALYNFGTRFRNHLYDIGHKPSFEFDTTVIVVGNLNVGGSGKTPMVEYLIQLLKKTYKIATLSRGYKRETKGYRLASENDSARILGDEPFQLYKKFGHEISVVVGEDRVTAIPSILHELPETQVILLDDALQHRPVKPQVTILVTEYAHPFYKDFVLPFGRLRESRRGANRSDIIVVTKCSGAITAQDRAGMISHIRKYAGMKPVFFSSIQYGEPEHLGNQKTITRRIILVTGIARSATLKNFCLENYTLIRHFNFGDHHRYTAKDLTTIQDFCKTQKDPISILTTEKDMVKLIAPELSNILLQGPWFYVPIQHVFLEDGLKFDNLISAAVNKGLPRSE